MKRTRFFRELGKRRLRCRMGGIRDSARHMASAMQRGLKKLGRIREYVETLKFISKILLAVMSLIGVFAEIYLSYDPWRDMLTIGW